MEPDLDTISQVLEVLSKGTKATNGAISVGDKIKTFFKSSKSSGNEELEALVMELMSEVKDAKIANLDLKEQLIMLRDNAMKANARSEDFDRYELWETPTGSIVYQLKKMGDQEEPHHYLCPTCKEGGIKSILQGHEEYRSCPKCETGFKFKKSEIIRVARRQRSLDDYRL